MCGCVTVGTVNWKHSYRRNDMKQFKPVTEDKVNIKSIDDLIDFEDKQEEKFEVIGMFLTYPYAGDEVRTVHCDNFVTPRAEISDMTLQIRKYFGEDLVKIFTTDRGIRAIVKDIHDDEGIHIYDFALAITSRKPVSRLG